MIIQSNRLKRITIRIFQSKKKVEDGKQERFGWRVDITYLEAALTWGDGNLRDGQRQRDATQHHFSNKKQKNTRARQLRQPAYGKSPLE